MGGPCKGTGQSVLSHQLVLLFLTNGGAIHLASRLGAKRVRPSVRTVTNEFGWLKGQLKA